MSSSLCWAENDLAGARFEFNTLRLSGMIVPKKRCCRLPRFQHREDVGGSISSDIVNRPLGLELPLMLTDQADQAARDRRPPAHQLVSALCGVYPYS